VDSTKILEQLQEQRGKCMYTGHHLGFENGKWNCISVERFDVNLGYTTGNWCLIMACLNTLDFSAVNSLANEPKTGSGGWTKEKMDYFRNFVNATTEQN
jgi:hypothetical protein